MRKIFALLLAATFLYSCGGDDNNNNNNTANNADSSQKERKTIKIDFAVLSAIPDPIETASLIKALELRYDKAALNSLDNKSKYATDFKRAINLGVYSTDLGYANIYGQTQDAIDYLLAVREMAEGLNIDKYVDFAGLRSLTAGGEGLDKILEVTLSSLNTINEELQKENRGEATAFIISGSWIESLYLSCYLAQKSKNKELKLAIAEQKIALKHLLNLLENNKGASKHIDELYEDLSKLNSIYANISVEYQETEATEQIVDGQKQVIQADTVDIQFSDADFEALLKAITEIRSKIVA